VAWIATGFGSDRAPAWSPDGARIAFLRMPPDPVKSTLDPEPPARFEIWVADANTGKAHAAFRSADRTAGHAQDEELWPVQWAAEDLLVFPWEHDNWSRLYAVPAKGGQATPLSPSRCEARTPRLSGTGDRLVYVASGGGLARFAAGRPGTSRHPRPRRCGDSCAAFPQERRFRPPARSHLRARRTGSADAARVAAICAGRLLPPGLRHEPAPRFERPPGPL